MGRILALVIILIPGAFAALGIKLLRDTIFGIIIAPFPYLWLQGIAGLFFLGAGLYVVAGFILYRDRKRNKVTTRFKQR
ncbi:hypothetical protein BK049_16175 [Bacillus xiamenensis]|uniref:DUF2627 domain-containing protein n=1 Tax=Bacillus xiamenensis TaxID=1178537 RepID=A0AAC9NDT5_9BACI|nr:MULTISPECIES: DUF2627 domain-containing protein [Bacillus]AOZ90100.1 hypothetical protein BK049_16175 [Bacillus xiamenensis]EKF35361.1 hypothetical protein BA1_10656 [Bacillus xiamenensis]MBG9911474.1 hypothetical protein [Bacillus xiamenensis]MCW1837521.1 DUF2627 domain-containing protein [Bacillus xiamenensis]MCY9576694.1 DUF2627 domain-containing protein [Bacillus xiamenensis]